ncbi:hypothetical protein [Sphingomonas sp.]|uniref:hypothetical protein n=1 Tax=Sphingomonas sp. TaxID=28214 RepID=UPI003B00EA58
MTAALADDDGRVARLLRTGVSGTPGRRVAPGQPTEIARGSITDLVAIVRADEGDELWRYTIVVDDSEYIRNAELRALVRAS